MKKILIIIICFGIIKFCKAQDLNATVKIAGNKLTQQDPQLLNDMQTAIFNFLNNRKWTEEKIQPNERIDCNFVITLTAQEGDVFKANVEIQSSRPVYGTTYSSILFFHLDEDWKFRYTIYQPLEYQENANLNQLTTLLAFYSNIIIGLDYNSFSEDGGLNYFRKAQQLRDLAVNEEGWTSQSGKNNRNRYYLIDNLMDDRFKPIHKTYYQYHIKGMDILAKDPELARDQIFESIQEIKKIFAVLPNSMMLKSFFNAKNKELVLIFKGGSASQKQRIVELLTTLDPPNRSKYEEILKQ